MLVAACSGKRRFFPLLVLLFCVFSAIIGKSCVFNAAAAAPAGEGGVLIVDAGHGGLDGGASTAGGVTESTINLEIAEKLAFLARFFGVETVMTRTAEELDYPDEAGTVRQKKVWDQKRRIALIKGTENAVLISIHQNKFPDPRPRGSQALYGKTEGSKELGEITHAMLNEKLNPENRRVAAPISEKIYLMRSIDCPAVLVECGFLSNAGEAALLCDGGYQTKLAAVLLASYSAFMDSYQ